MRLGRPGAALIAPIAMRVEILGGGPAGLTLAILLKSHDSRHRVRVVERGPRGATWGFGVAFDIARSISSRPTRRRCTSC